MSILAHFGRRASGDQYLLTALLREVAIGLVAAILMAD
jgi:hypothetical protein